MSSSTLSTHSPTSQKTFDVLLSYYGLGSRKNFVDDILYALERRGISTHMTDISSVGAHVSCFSQGIFEPSSSSSSVAVIIFCRDYSTTPRCLDELVKIMKLSKTTRLKILPVFYYVDPFELRNYDRRTFEETRRGIGWKSFLFRNYFGTYSKKSLKLWRLATEELTKLQGLTLDMKNTPDTDDLDFVEEIAETVIGNLGW